MNPKRLIFIDTDLNYPSDDFEALCLFLADKNVEVTGIGAAAGNTWAEEVLANTYNALRILGKEEISIGIGPNYKQFVSHRGWALEQAARGVRDFIGAYCKSPTPRLWVTDQWHGLTSWKAHELLKTAVLSSPCKVDIVGLGPLSNLVLALRGEPRLASKIGKVFVMGGNFGREPEKDSPIIDFNFWFDPEAANYVLRSGIEVWLLPLDTCKRSALMEPLFLQKLLRESGSGARIFLIDMLGMIEQHGVNLPLCDVLLALLVLDPFLIRSFECGTVTVDTSQTDARGLSRFEESPKGNVRLIRQVNIPGAQIALLNRLQKMSRFARSPGVHFDHPCIQYFLQERIQKRPYFSLPFFLTEIGIQEGPIVRLADTRTFNLFVSQLIEVWLAKKEAEWILELFIAGSKRTLVSSRDPKENPEPLHLESDLWHRLLRMEAIATISDTTRGIFGFTGASVLTSNRKEKIQEKYRFQHSAKEYFLELWILGGDPGDHVFETMIGRLTEWLGQQIDTGELLM